VLGLTAFYPTSVRNFCQSALAHSLGQNCLGQIEQHLVVKVVNFAAENVGEVGLMLGNVSDEGEHLRLVELQNGRVKAAEPIDGERCLQLNR